MTERRRHWWEFSSPPTRASTTAAAAAPSPAAPELHSTTVHTGVRPALTGVFQAPNPMFLVSQPQHHHRPPDYLPPRQDSAYTSNSGHRAPPSPDTIANNPSKHNSARPGFPHSHILEPSLTSQQPHISHLHTAKGYHRNPPKSAFSVQPPAGEPERLHSHPDERDVYDDMSAVFSLLTAMERLENMWARRGAIAQDEYELQCEKLIQQYAVLRPSTERSIPNLDEFIARFECKAHMARARLKAGVPSTVVVPGAAAGKPKDLGKFSMRCTEQFHQLVTCIETGQLEVGLLLPELASLAKSLETTCRMTGKSNVEFNDKLKVWKDRLNSISASSSLSLEDAAQLKLDLDTSYIEFKGVFND